MIRAHSFEAIFRCECGGASEHEQLCTHTHTHNPPFEAFRLKSLAFVVVALLTNGVRVCSCVCVWFRTYYVEFLNYVVNGDWSKRFLQLIWQLNDANKTNYGAILNNHWVELCIYWMRIDTPGATVLDPLKHEFHNIFSVFFPTSNDKCTRTCDASFGWVPARAVHSKSMDISAHIHTRSRFLVS